jgi:hypothetical protein
MPETDNAVFMLGKSIQLMSEAELVVFANNWEEARGCMIEYETAKRYNIPHIYLCDFNG